MQKYRKQKMRKNKNGLAHTLLGKEKKLHGNNQKKWKTTENIYWNCAENSIYYCATHCSTNIHPNLSHGKQWEPRQRTH